MHNVPNLDRNKPKNIVAECLSLQIVSDIRSIYILFKKADNAILTQEIIAVPSDVHLQKNI